MFKWIISITFFIFPLISVDYSYSDTILKAQNEGIKLNPELIKKREDVEKQFQKIEKSKSNVENVIKKNQQVIDKIW